MCTDGNELFSIAKRWAAHVEERANRGGVRVWEWYPEGRMDHAVIAMQWKHFLLLLRADPKSVHYTLEDFDAGEVEVLEDQPMVASELLALLDSLLARLIEKGRAANAGDSARKTGE